GGFMSWIRDKIASIVSSVMDPIGRSLPKLPGTVGKFPKAAFDWMQDKVIGFIKAQGDESGYNGPVGGGVERWRGLVEKILSDKGLPLSLANSVLRRMDQESGGNPRAINNWDSNAAAGTPSKGLMQTIDPTFQSYKDPGYDNIWDPEANIRASMNYALARYGSLPAAYDRAGGYALGGVIPKIPTDFGLYRDNGGYIPPGKSVVTNETGRPEAVLNWEQLSGSATFCRHCRRWRTSSTWPTWWDAWLPRESTIRGPRGSVSREKTMNSSRRCGRPAISGSLPPRRSRIFSRLPVRRL